MIYFDLVDGKKVVCDSLRSGSIKDVNWPCLLEELGLAEVYNEDKLGSIPPHRKISNDRLYQHSKDKSLFVAVITYGNSIRVATSRMFEDFSDPYDFIREGNWTHSQLFVGKLHTAFDVADYLVDGIRDMYA